MRGVQITDSAKGQNPVFGKSDVNQRCIIRYIEQREAVPHLYDGRVRVCVVSETKFSNTLRCMSSHNRKYSPGQADIIVFSDNTSHPVD